MKEKLRLKLLRVEEEKRPEEAGNAGSVDNLSEQKHGPFKRRLIRAGVKISPFVYGVIATLVSIFAGYIGLSLGIILCLFVTIACAQYLFVGYLEERALKRRKLVIPHLAPFIDGLASALSTGFNLEGAVAQAAQGVPPGLLRTELNRVVNALNQGLAIKDAVGVLRDQISGREVTSLVVSLGLFSTMGGHVLEPFRRLARKIREQEVAIQKATRDLVLVKQAFFIIFFLSCAVPVLLAIVQPDYLAAATKDSTGRVLLQIGAMIVIGSLLGFKKIVNIRI